MTHSEGWSPYAGNSSVILAVVLLIVTGVLIYVAIPRSCGGVYVVDR